MFIMNIPICRLKIDAHYQTTWCKTVLLQEGTMSAKAE